MALIASFVGAASVLTACAGTGRVTLPSGTRVMVTRVGRIYFAQSGPALMISYQTSVDISDVGKLRREADELFAYERKLIDQSNVDGVILSATHSSGGTIFHFSRGYNFIYQRRAGAWYGLDENKRWTPVR